MDQRSSGSPGRTLKAKKKFPEVRQSSFPAWQGHQSIILPPKNTLDMLRIAGIEDQFRKRQIHITMNMPMTDPNCAAIYGAPWIPSTKTPVMLRHVSIYPSTMDPSWDESNIVKPFKAPYFGGASSHPQIPGMAPVPPVNPCSVVAAARLSASAGARGATNPGPWWCCANASARL